MHIRKYKSSDRKQIEFINFETGFLGSSMSKFLSNNKLWKKEIKYYLDKEPESIFVLENKNPNRSKLRGIFNVGNPHFNVSHEQVHPSTASSGVFLTNKDKIAGYLLGCLNDKNNNETINFILHNIENLFQSIFLLKKDRIFWRSQFMSLINTLIGRSEEIKFKTPKNAGHIHINLLPEARGKNYGTRLLKEFERYAKQEGVKTIHADSYQTKINPNTHFWLKNGFKVYSKVKTSIWKKQLPEENINLICYSKNLAP